MIVVATIIAITILSIRMVGKEDRNRIHFIEGIKEINRIYKELFSNKDTFAKLTESGLIIFGEIFSFVCIGITIRIALQKYVGINIGGIIKSIIIISSCAIIHYLMGYMVLISSRIYRRIGKEYIESIGADFLLSYFITSTYLMVLLGFPHQLEKYAISGIIGVIICYFLNLRILISIMRNPQEIKFSGEKKSSFTRIIVAAFIILVMIILNLYLGVCLIDALEGYAFSQSLGYFDLFYYTMITFTTIGFGDIIPLSVPAKISAIIISITSVICLSIFLASIFSYNTGNLEEIENAQDT